LRDRLTQLLAVTVKAPAALSMNRDIDVPDTPL